MNCMMTEKHKSIIAVLLGNFFFGTSVIAVKHITPIFIAPLALTSIRIAVCALLFWVIYFFRPVKTSISGKDYLRLLFCAIMGITFNQTFSIRGMSLTSPIHASLLVLTTPIVVSILAAIFLKERLTNLKILGLSLGITGGALLILSRDSSNTLAKQETIGDLFIILGAFSYASYLVTIKPLILKYSAMHILQWVFLFGGMISVPLGWNSFRLVQWSEFDALSWFCLVYVVLGATFLAYLLMNYSVSKLGAGITASFIYLQPFFATVASMILLHEQLTFSKMLSATIIMVGVFVTNYKTKSSVIDKHKPILLL